jgi:DNA-binding transcriptional ArsR family regulator
MKDYLKITAALSDASRVRAVLALSRGELCVCQIIDLLGLAPSTVSKHMSLLHDAGLVLRRKDGRWHYYRLAGDNAAPAVRRALKWTIKSLAKDPVAKADRKQLGSLRERRLAEIAACCYQPESATDTAEPARG